MKSAFRVSLIAAALSCTMATPVNAQDANANATADELAQMRAQLQALSQRIDQLEGELAKANTTIAAQATATPAAPPAAPAEATATIAWKGAPQIEGKGGWSFKPRGRMQIDAGTISSPNGISDNSTGFGSEMRRAYLGFEGKVPGGFGYRAEIDVANSSVEVTDLYMTYNPSKSTTILIGQTKPFWGLEEMTSDLFTSFTERAAFNSSIGFERRLGVAAMWNKGPVLLQGGVFTDNLSALNNDENNSLSYHARAVYMPKLGGGQLHLGGSFHYRDMNDKLNVMQYRARPFIHTPDIRFIDTRAIAADADTGYGLEAAYINGPFHATGEAHWQKVNRIAAADPTFFGGYAEVGYYLTGDTRGYKGGVFDRTTPKKSVAEGGIGALQLNLRYDYLDLVDAGIVGGKQDTYAIGLVWSPTAYTRFLANYGHIVYSDAAIATATGDRDYSVDAFGVRAQIDF